MPRLLAYHGNRKTCGWKLSCHKIDPLFCHSKSVLGQISFITHGWRWSVFCIAVETVLMFFTEMDLDLFFSPNLQIWFTFWLGATVLMDWFTYRCHVKARTWKRLERMLLQNYSSRTQCSKNISARTYPWKQEHTNAPTSHWQSWYIYIYMYIYTYVYIITYIYIIIYIYVYTYMIIYVCVYSNAFCAIFQTYIHQSSH